eukprot:snap_masked-scaffold_49-processed-gene-1.53-mRNA-1 protein AED:1.00 eAED:1.00 QI:0/-1/0/0/-1/1/1/0/88
MDVANKKVLKAEALLAGLLAKGDKEALKYINNPLELLEKTISKVKINLEEVVAENVEMFEMSEEAAKSDALEQMRLQGVDSEILDFCR